MDDETIRDIHRRLAVIEKDTKCILANTENLRWVKWHIRALWVALLGILGINIGGH